MEFPKENWQTWLKEKSKAGLNRLKNTNRTKLLKIGLIIALAGISLLALFVLTVRWGLYGPIPSKEQLTNIENPQASIVYDHQQEILGKYFIQNRTNVAYEDISAHMINALVATEDARFYQHKGIDWRSWLRVFFKTFLRGQTAQGGGSTISQQLAKNLFPRKHYRTFSTPINKLKEVFIARRLEKVFTKDEILTLYLNTVSFGGTTFGVRAACRQIFNTTPAKVNIQEAALLVGMLKASTAYHPKNDPDRSMQRRNTVLQRMHQAAIIDEQDRDSLSQLPIKLDLVDERESKGIATYFREQLRQDLGGILEEYNRTHETRWNLYTDGLLIHTTIDRQIQKAAEAAMAKRMKKLQEEIDAHWGAGKPWHQSTSLERLVQQSERYDNYKSRGYSEKLIDSLFAKEKTMRIFTWEGMKEVKMSPLDSVKYYQGLLQTGILSCHPKTGAIKAWVGGIDHEHTKYDHVLSKRQTGSIFKPIVYARALELGYTPCDYLENELMTYVDYDDWTPKNSNGEYGGLYSLQGALSHSVNTVTVWLALETGLDSLVSLAKAMGFSGDLPTLPSISLGSAEASLWDMIQIYSVIANHGRKQPMHYLEKVEAPNGTIIYEHQPTQSTRVLNPTQADLLLHMMKNTINYGTASALRTAYKFTNDIAGKTGTTQDHTDGWFVGMTPDLVTGVWVGGDDPLVRFRHIGQGQGAHMAMPTWAYMHQQLYRDGSLTKSKFDPLPYEWRDYLDCEDFIERYFMPWEQEQEERIAQRRDRKEQRRTRRDRRRKNKESKLERFFKDLFKR